MLSDKMKQELIMLAQMQTREEEDQDQLGEFDIETDAQIELARKVLNDLKIAY